MWCPQYYDYNSTSQQCQYTLPDCSNTCPYAFNISKIMPEAYTYSTTSPQYNSLIQNYMNNLNCFTINANKKYEYCRILIGWPNSKFTKKPVYVQSIATLYNHYQYDSAYGMMNQGALDETGYRPNGYPVGPII